MQLNYCAPAVPFSLLSVEYRYQLYWYLRVRLRKLVNRSWLWRIIQWISGNQEQQNTLTSWKPRVTSWLSRLFLEYHYRLSKKAKNLRAFPGFCRLFRGKKAWKSQESQELRSFLCYPGFFFAGGCLLFEKMGLGALTQREVLKFNGCLCCGSNFIFFSLVRCYLN